MNVKNIIIVAHREWIYIKQQQQIIARMYSVCNMEVSSSLLFNMCE